MEFNSPACLSSSFQISVFIENCFSYTYAANKGNNLLISYLPILGETGTLQPPRETRRKAELKGRAGVQLAALPIHLGAVRHLFERDAAGGWGTLQQRLAWSETMPGKCAPKSQAPTAIPTCFLSLRPQTASPFRRPL